MTSSDLPQRLPVTDQGVLLPKSLFGNATEVQVVLRASEIIVAAAARANDESPRALLADELNTANLNVDDWGVDPIDDTVTDASINHDRYIYGGDR